MTRKCQLMDSNSFRGLGFAEVTLIWNFDRWLLPNHISVGGEIFQLADELAPNPLYIAIKPQKARFLREAPHES